MTKKVEQLSCALRIAFAAACAERLLTGYAKYAAKTGGGGLAVLREILTRLWKDLEGERMSDAEVDAAIKTCLQMIPQEEGSAWVPEQATADDAAAALAYALGCRRSCRPEEAVLAAQRAYDALDEFVIYKENVDTNVPGAEDRVVSHPLIQTELARQQRDIDELLQRLITVTALRDRSRVEAATFLP